MRVNFLAAAGLNLSKTFTPTGVEPYPNAAKFTSYAHTVADLPEFLEALTLHAERGDCLLKGELQVVLNDERRAGSTSSLTPTEYIVLDLDFAEGFDSIDAFLDTIGLAGVSYILHHSASSGIRYAPGLRSHIIMLLDQPYAPSALKPWLIGLNLKVPALRAQCQLGATGYALKWALDVTTCQNDKLIFIADPQCHGIDDPMAGKRFELHLRDQDRVRPDFSRWVEGDLRTLEEGLINELRELKGLPRTKAKFYTALYSGQTVEYLKNPTQAIVSDVKVARGFVYVNLNGGDSWGYYYPEGKFEYLYNFKGEPIVRLRDIDPDYYQSVRAEADNNQVPLTEPEEGETKIWRIISRYEFATAYLAEWSPTELRLTPQSTQQLELMEQSVEFTRPGFETWVVEYDPTRPMIDPEARWANLYRLSIYQQQTHQPVDIVPSTIATVLRWLLGSDEPSYQHFLRWLAWIFQTGQMARTAWLIRGVEGTGKGVLCNNILRPLFGSANLMEMTTEKAVESKNGWIKGKQILVVDEGEVSGKEADAIMSTFRNMITEPKITVREMRKQSREEDNWINVLLLTNSRAPIKLSTSDRRWNIPPFQERPLLDVVDPSKFIPAIEAELPAFAAYLKHKTIDLTAPPPPLESDAKQQVITASTTSNEEFFHALSSGDFNYLADNYFYHPGYELHSSWAKYRSAIIRWYQEYKKSPRVFVSSVEAFEAFKYITGANPNEKFGSWVKHAGHKMRAPVRGYVDGGQCRGYHIEFKPLEEQWQKMLEREALKTKSPQERLALVG